VALCQICSSSVWRIPGTSKDTDNISTWYKEAGETKENIKYKMQGRIRGGGEPAPPPKLGKH